MPNNHINYNGSAKKVNVLCLNRNINVDLMKSAALLHDITRTRSFTTGEAHADTSTSAGLIIEPGRQVE